MWTEFHVKQTSHYEPIPISPVAFRGFHPEPQLLKNLSKLSKIKYSEEIRPPHCALILFTSCKERCQVYEWQLVSNSHPRNSEYNGYFIWTKRKRGGAKCNLPVAESTGIHLEHGFRSVMEVTCDCPSVTWHAPLSALHNNASRIATADVKGINVLFPTRALVSASYYISSSFFIAPFMYTEYVTMCQGHWSIIAPSWISLRETQHGFPFYVFPARRA